jgi:hypothetical protein
MDGVARLSQLSSYGRRFVADLVSELSNPRLDDANACVEAIHTSGQPTQ